MTTGMSVTGKQLDGIAHVRQSIADILTTPIGTRVMRREYGSELAGLLDRPLTQGTLVDVYAAVASALAKWEPRFRLSAVRAAAMSAGGRCELELTGIYLIDGREVVMDGIVL